MKELFNLCIWSWESNLEFTLVLVCRAKSPATLKLFKLNYLDGALVTRWWDVLDAFPLCLSIVIIMPLTKPNFVVKI